MDIAFSIKTLGTILQVSACTMGVQLSGRERRGRERRSWERRDGAGRDEIIFYNMDAISIVKPSAHFKAISLDTKDISKP